MPRQIKDEPISVDVDIGARAGQSGKKLLPMGSKKRTKEETAIAFSDDSIDELKPLVKPENAPSKVRLRVSWCELSGLHVCSRSQRSRKYRGRAKKSN